MADLPTPEEALLLLRSHLDWIKGWTSWERDASGLRANTEKAQEAACELAGLIRDRDAAVRRAALEEARAIACDWGARGVCKDDNLCVPCARLRALAEQEPKP